MNVSDTTADVDIITNGVSALPDYMRPSKGFVSNFFEQFREIAVVTPLTTYTTVNCFTALAAQPQVNSFLKNCQNLRGSPTIKIIFTGSPALYGMVRFVFTPAFEFSKEYYTNPSYPRDLAPDLYGNDGFYYTSGLPHLDFDVSCICEQQIKLPYHFTAPFALNSSKNDWNITCYQLHPVIANFTGGSTIVKARIQVAYTDVEYLSLIPQGKDESDSGLVSSGLKYMANFSTPYSKLFSLGASVAEHFGWSKLPDPPPVMRIVSDMSSITGALDSTYTLGKDPRSMIPDKQDLLPGEPLTRATLTGEWSPLYQELYPGNGIEILPGVCSTNYDSRLSTFALVHKYWRGELELMMKVYANSLIRGKIAYNIFPPGSDSTVPVLNGTAISGIIDIVGSTEVLIKVPYLYAEAFRPVALTNPGGGLDNTRLKYFWIDGPWDQQGPLEVLPFVDLYIRGPNTEFAFPTLDNTDIYKREGKDDAVRYTYGEQPDDVLQLCKRSSMMAKTYNMLKVPLYFPAAGITPDRYPHVLSAGDSLRKVEFAFVNWTYDTWFRAHALAFSGSSTYITSLRLPSTDEHSFATSTTIEVPGVSSSSYSTKTQMNFSTGEGYQLFENEVTQVRVPLVSTNPFLKTELGVSPNYDFAIKTVCFDAPAFLGSASATIVVVYGAAGDDRQMSFFIPMKYTATHL